MGVHDGHRDRLRQRFLDHGLGPFAEHEALELLLYYAIPRRDTNLLAHRLINHFGSLSQVLSASMEELLSVDGVTLRGAILIHMVPQMLRRACIEKPGVVLNSAQSAGAYLLRLFEGKTMEIVFQLCLDRKGRLLSCRKLSEGGISAAAVDVRAIVGNALLASASSVILAHNHPSGIALPSPEDYAATDKIRAALEAVGVPLQDHIIVAGEDYVSMRESGYLNRSL